MVATAAVGRWLARYGTWLILAAFTGAAGGAPALAQDMAPTPKGAYVKITSPANGAVVKSPVKVTMAVHGMEINPAGPLKEGTGHHHLVIDTVPPAAGVAVPADAQNLHYGKGQTEAELALTPGIHTLTAAFADGVHRVYGPQMTDTIVIRVE